jgi:hypothetical protein
MLSGQIIQLHNRYTQLASDAWQFNVTFVDYSSLVSLIRQIEFLLLQMTIQLEERNVAVQNVLTGKLPIAILKPYILHKILRNISLIILGSCELAAGLNLENIHAYYDIISTSVVGNAHGLYLILEIPVKTANQIFNLYRIITLPTKVLDDTFAMYKLDFNFVGWTHNRRHYVRMTESDILKFKAGTITICPADKAVFVAQTLTCESRGRPKAGPARGS